MVKYEHTKPTRSIKSTEAGDFETRINETETKTRKMLTNGPKASVSLTLLNFPVTLLDNCKHFPKDLCQTFVTMSLALLLLVLS